MSTGKQSFQDLVKSWQVRVWCFCWGCYSGCCMFLLCIQWEGLRRLRLRILRRVLELEQHWEFYCHTHILILSQRSAHAGTVSSLEFLTQRQDPLGETGLILLSAPQPRFPALYLSLSMCVAAGRSVCSCKRVCLYDVCVCGGRKGVNLLDSGDVEVVGRIVWAPLAQFQQSSQSCSPPHNASENDPCHTGFTLPFYCYFPPFQ